MNAIALPPVGSLLDADLYVGRILIAGRPFAILLPPKAIAEHAATIWIARGKSVPEALSWNDGLANTEAMARAGSRLAQWALDLRFYIPSVDELELAYRALKPTAETNTVWGRSGVNASADPPTHPYTADLPQQTALEAYRAGGTEAFEPEAHWTSTQHASDSSLAWSQYFINGYQYDWSKGVKLRARAVRRLPL